MKRIGNALELNIKLTTYVARHSAVSMAHNKGADLSFIKEKTGHSNDKSTEQYINSLDNGKTAKWQGVL